MGMRENQETVVITRVFDARRDRVFQAWTQAEHLSNWFAPHGFTITDCEAQAHAGGIFKLCMRSPRGDAFWVRGEYREVVRPERLLIACTMADPQGVARVDETIDVRFEAAGRRTRLKLNSTARGVGPVAAAMLAGFPQGWTQTVERLRELFRPKHDKEM